MKDNLQQKAESNKFHDVDAVYEIQELKKEINLLKDNNQELSNQIYIILEFIKKLNIT